MKPPLKDGPPGQPSARGVVSPGPQFPVHRAFLPVALAAGILYALLNPPFQAPDESAHWWRAIYIVNGATIAGPGDAMPRAYIETVMRFHRDLKLHIGPDGRLRRGDILALLRMPLRIEDREPFPILSVNPYNPIPYLPQIPAILIGQRLSLPPIAIAYLGRFLNLFAWAALACLALRIIPVFRWGLFLLALMPMTVHQAASLSADGFVIAISFLYIAFVLRLACAAPGAAVTRADILLLALLTLLLTLAKMNLALLLLLVLVPRGAFRSRAAYILTLAAIAGTAIAAAALWNHANAWALAAYRTRQSGLDPAGQARFILRSPMHFLSILVSTLRMNGRGYCTEFVGRLGWLNAKLPRPLIIAYGVALLLASLLTGEGAVLRPRQKLLAGLVFLLSALSVFVFLWITETPPGSTTIGGVQGRYFIPFAPLGFVLFAFGRVCLPRRAVAAVLIVFVALTHAITLRTLYARYYGPPPSIAPAQERRTGSPASRGAGMRALPPNTTYPSPPAT